MASVRLNGDTSGFIEISAPNVAGSTTITLPATSGGDFLVTDSNGDLNVDSGTLFVDASTDRVGVGTTSPNYKLHLHSATTGDSNYLQITHADAGSGASDGLQLGLATGSSPDAYLAQKENGALIFQTNAQNRARIDSSGRLLVNTSSEFGTSSRSSWYSLLQIRGNTSAATSDGRITLGTGDTVGSNTSLGSLYFCDQNGGDRALIRGFSNTAGGSENYPGYLAFYTNSGAANPTERMRILSNGAFTNMTGVYNDTTGSAANMVVNSSGSLQRSTSSAKYKTDIETLEDQYADALLACRPVWYRSTCAADNPDWGWWGLIAEEVAEIDPRLVHWKTTEPVVQENGGIEHVPCELEPEGVAYDRFVPHLLNLIKRQKEQLETQAASIASLEARLTALEGGAS